MNKALVIINPAGANLDNPIKLEPIGNGQFRYSAPVGGGPVGEIVRFVEENGRVVRMITGDSRSSASGRRRNRRRPVAG